MHALLHIMNTPRCIHADDFAHKHGALHMGLELMHMCRAACICAEPFVYMQRRLQICKAACRFAKPGVHVHEPDFINTWCFQRCTSLKRRPEFVMDTSYARFSSSSSSYPAQGEKRPQRAAVVRSQQTFLKTTR